MEKLSFDQLPSAVDQLTKKLENIERLLLENGNLKPPNLPEELLTVEQTAKFLNLTIPTIYSKVSRRELPVMKRSHRLYFSRNELIDYLKQGRKKTNTEIEQEANNYLKQR